MSLTQTYYIAASARSKLGREACRPDHNLRLLVGHANLLDSLMLDLAEAEREQEAWFNQNLRKAAKDEPKHIQWADTIVDEEEEDSDDSSDDSDSDFYDEDGNELDMIPPLRRIPSPPIQIKTTEVDEDEEDEDFYEDYEDDEEHALTRTSSNSPPELVNDSDSDDESPPPSPPQPILQYTEKQRQAIATTSYYDRKSQALSTPEQLSFIEEGYFIPERNNAPMITSY